MAVRTPLFWDTTTSSIKEMPTSQINKIIERVTYLYGLNPSVEIDIVSSDGSLPSLFDNRLQAGTSGTSATAPLPELVIGSVTINQTEYDKLDLLYDTVSTVPIANTDQITFPLYFDGNDLRAMTQQDFFDTFIYPAVDLLVADTTNPKTTAGTYTVSTSSSLSAHTAIGNFFTDTVADVDAYTKEGIPETLDQPDADNEVNYYLHRRTANKTNILQPLVALAAGDAQIIQLSQFDTLLQTSVRQVAAYDTNGYKIEYDIAPDGIKRGTGIVNRQYNDDKYEKDRFGADDYRSQMFPAGSIVTSDPSYLIIRKV